jgi:hypothetical protein
VLNILAAKNQITAVSRHSSMLIYAGTIKKK